MQSEHTKSVEFLRRFKPQGQWVLTAISPDKKEIVTDTFYEEEPCLTWLQEHGARKNIYFHVNGVMHDLKKKALRAETKSLDWLHIDVDPRAGEDIKDEQERALRLLQNPPGNIPPPSIIIFSGGGYQGFWKLETPVPIDGKEEIFEDVKLYNRQLEIIFAADECHNVDRIMRLPGTINHPTPTKAKKGRKKALAKLIEFNDNVYPIESFTKAPMLQSPEVQGFSKKKAVNISSNIVPTLEDIDDLGPTVSDYCKSIIVQGKDLDNLKKWPSRSECLFWVCCELVRSGISDEQIYAVITDPSFKISESVLEKGNSMKRYAEKQIRSAKEEAIDPYLRQMNENHAVIANYGGKCRVMSRIFDHTIGRNQISLQSFPDLKNRYSNIRVDIGEDGKGNRKSKPLGNWWLDHPERLQFDSMVFAPGKTLKNDFNLWEGFAYNAKPGNGHDLFLKHIQLNICQGNKEHYEYILGWMARAVQRPDLPGHVAIVLRGKRGTGKSFFAKIFGALFGRHFLQISDSKHLVGSFNSHLRDCSVLFGDEAFYAGDKRHESVLKTLITEDTLAVEAKGVDMKISGNYIHLILASNDDWVIPAGANERRFFVVDVDDARMRDGDYFYSIRKAMRDENGYESLLYTLLNHNISDYRVEEIPHTRALQDQKNYSMSAEQDWWYSKLKSGHLLPAHEGWYTDVADKLLLLDYYRHTRMHTGRKQTGTQLSIFLKKYTDNADKKQVREAITITELDGTEYAIQRPYFWKFPDLKTCRKIWDREFGNKEKWDDGPK